MSDDPDDEGPWTYHWSECTLCGYRCVSVHPVAMISNGECAECHHMTMEECDA
jgi:hypothetical protein